LIGENTDGKGFLKALREDGQCNPEGKKIMVLGAGGASRAICTELALVGAGEILIANRSFSKAETLAGHISSHTGTKASALVWKSHLGLPPDLDILVNATSIGLYPDSEN
jgi:shikimate dehydrogenase